MQSLKIGIVTISYNQGRYLQEAIESVIANNQIELSYIIVDPGSTDGSLEIIHKYQNCFNKIILEKDNGPADGLNKGFAVCDADILGYLNADDRLVPGALEWILNYFKKHPDCNAIMGGIRIIDEYGNITRKCVLPWNVNVKGVLNGTTLMLQQGMFFRRSVWEKTQHFNVQNHSCWDGELAVDIMLAGIKIRSVPKILGEFRLYSDSITGAGQYKKIYKLDQKRIAEKIIQRGYKYSRIPHCLQNIAFRYHPIRRLREFIITG